MGRHSRDTMGVIAKNKEDYISFSGDVALNKYVDKEGNEKEKLIKLRFIDSFKFMASSLDSLTRNLAKGRGKLFEFENYPELQYKLLLGQAILDLRKIIMYEFHYDYMKPKYGENLKLCYMDTDSLVYKIKTKDFYADIVDDFPARFDTSG